MTTPLPVLGASWIHSAEEAEDAYCTVPDQLPPLVTSVMLTPQELTDCCVIETVTVSPGATVSGTGCDACGSVSIHASYWTTPLSTKACVPAWTRSVVVAPPMPTHVASALVPVGATVGTVHVPL